jgi:BirA family biotin operon repressor/biotin-[acetyl-CoA-carboxylase] ligase
MPEFDARAVQTASGWTVHHFPLLPSTMDEAARLRASGAGARTVVVADAQSAGRGREGRAFSSPEGGLYASLLVAAEAGDLPGPLVAASALAVAEGLEQAAGVVCTLKWPNDVWIGGKKVAGLLLEGAAGTLVSVGVGVNVLGVPRDLPEDLRRTLTSLDVEARRPVAREQVLVAILARLDRRLADLRSSAARASVAEDWSRRLALKGERVSWTEAGRRHTGRLLGADLESGLDVLDDVSGRRRLRGEHVQDVRPDPPPVPPNPPPPG